MGCYYQLSLNIFDREDQKKQVDEKGRECKENSVEKFLNKFAEKTYLAFLECTALRFHPIIWQLN